MSVSTLSAPAPLWGAAARARGREDPERTWHDGSLRTVRRSTLRHACPPVPPWPRRPRYQKAEVRDVELQVQDPVS